MRLTLQHAIGDDGGMETWDAIGARRNVRSYLADPVSDGDLDRIAEAGWRAPSASNRQHWDFVIVTERHALEELSTVWRGAGHIASAPAAIALVVPEPADERTKLIDQYDLGQATLAMTIAATDLGIGTGHSAVGDQDRARALLGVPAGYIVSFLLGVGYPADRPFKPILKPDRRPFNEVVHRGHW
ncbi:nitroreductase family protein [soil metagenome]